MKDYPPCIPPVSLRRNGGRSEEDFGGEPLRLIPARQRQENPASWALRKTLPSMAIQGYRSFHERLERARVDLLTFVNVDRPSSAAFQAGIEEARRVRDFCPVSECELHNFRVCLPSADD